MQNPLEEKIFGMMDKPTFQSKSLEELKEILGIKNEKKAKILLEALYNLEKAGRVMKTRTNLFNSPKNLGMKIGVVLKGSNTYLFVKHEDEEEEYFIPPKFTKNALEGDKVLIKLKKDDDVKPGEKRTAKIVKVLERNSPYLVGTYVELNGEAFVLMNNRGEVKRLQVQRSSEAVEGHEVVVAISQEGEESQWVVQQVLGHKDEPTTEIVSLLYKFGIKHEFEEETLEEAETVLSQIPEDEIYMRQNLRDEMIVTIDGADAKDLDDAIHLKINEKGNYVLGVHIADVSYYVEKGSALDEEAFERGTSVYLTNKVVPMLPQKLSNGVCSLLPNVDRLTLTCEMEVDREGNVISQEIYQSVINTTARLTYNEVNEMLLDGKEDIINEYKHIYPMLTDMLALSHILKNKRTKKGAIDFDVPEAKIRVNEDNKPEQIDIRVRKEAEKLIEEFMLLANETIATQFSKMNLPFIYRIHDLPKEEKVLAVSDLLARLGHTDLYIEDYANPKEIQKAINGVKGQTIEKTIHTLAIRMMAKAIYSEDNKGHFGLAKEFYTHFTSPIRRYPDLIVHRLIREFLIDHNNTKKTRDYWAREIGDIAIQSSKREQKAAEAEREIIEIKKAEYMSEFIGEEFEGIVSSLTEFGFFVELDNTVQGLVSFESLDGHWYFDEENYTARSNVGNEVFSIGNKVIVELVSSNKDTKKIDFKYIKRV